MQIYEIITPYDNLKAMCSNCVFGQQLDMFNLICIRFPPTVNAHGEVVKTHVKSIDWCGEFKLLEIEE
jgi:hypothetical protein